ncbi:MAG: hypothetical protein DMG80_12310 [Acidobacteria bacterium]|jgi:hypothetical protein|nr:MAG: hypothetical protein DMG80_12310 [Acidobacteriota bacterium]
MQTTNHGAPASTKKLWAGRILSGLAILFLLMDGIIKLVNPAPVVKGMIRLGYPLNLTATIGIILLTCVVIHAIPQTSILGAILLTGYLGGAVASQLRVGEPLFSNVLFPIYMAAFIWGGLYLRDDRLRALVSFRR